MADKHSVKQIRAFHHPQWHDPEEEKISWYSVCDLAHDRFLAVIVHDDLGIIGIEDATLGPATIHTLTREMEAGRTIEISPKVVYDLLLGKI
jgi:hypothetical protein